MDLENKNDLLFCAGDRGIFIHLCVSHVTPMAAMSEHGHGQHVCRGKEECPAQYSLTIFFSWEPDNLHKDTCQNMRDFFLRQPSMHWIFPDGLNTTAGTPMRCRLDAC